MSYDARPETARVPLLVEDVEALLLTDGRDLAGSPAHVRHFLTRVRASFAASAERERMFQRELDRRTAEDAKRAHPVTVALAALAALDLADQRLVFDQRGQALLDAVEQSREQASAAHVAAASETNRARQALAEALTSRGLPPQERERLVTILESIPLMRRPPVGPMPAVEGAFVVPGTLERTLA